jgi:hypothetical protein
MHCICPSHRCRLLALHRPSRGRLALDLCGPTVMDTDLPSLTVRQNRKSLHPYESPSLLFPKEVPSNHCRLPRAGSLITASTPSRLARSPPQFPARFQRQTSSLATLHRCHLPMHHPLLGRSSHHQCSNPLRLPNCKGGHSRDRVSRTRIRKTRAATAVCRDLGRSQVYPEVSRARCIPT